jgi:hypothetical protein
VYALCLPSEISKHAQNDDTVLDFQMQIKKESCHFRDKNKAERRAMVHCTVFHKDKIIQERDLNS